MNYKNLNTSLLSFGILFLVLASTSIVAFHLLSPSDGGVEEKSIVVKSVELYDASIGWSPHIYKVDFIFDFISNEDFVITYGCSSPFWVKLVDSDDWQLVIGDCEALLTHSLEAGTTEYSLTADLISVGFNTSPDLPEELEIVVILGKNFVTSDPYSSSVDFWDEKSILIKSAELKTSVNQFTGVVTELVAVFDFTSDKTFNITYGCSSPFVLSLVSSDSWGLFLVDCEAILTHTLLEGTTEFSLSVEFRPINELNPPLPEQLSLRVRLAESLFSPVFNLDLS